MFNQIITIFNYIYMLLLKSDILQTECLAFPGKDKCNKCNLKTIYSPSPRWENIAYMYCANIYLYIYMCMYIYIYIYICIFPKQKVLLLAAMNFILSYLYTIIGGENSKSKGQLAARITFIYHPSSSSSLKVINQILDGYYASKQSRDHDLCG